MKCVTKLCLCVMLTLSASPAWASTGAPGQISRIQVMDGGLVLFLHTGLRTATPSCHTQGALWAFLASTSDGKAKLSHLMSAYALKKNISVVGLDSCGVQNGTETVDRFVIED